MKEVSHLIASLEETVHLAQEGANVGGIPCGGLIVLIFTFMPAE